MRTTIKDIAAACGVSIGTVSMALNGREGVNPETQSRILAMAKRLNYTPNYSARSLVRQKSDCIGLIVPEIQNPFYSGIVDTFTRIAEERDFRLILGISNNSEEREKGCIQMFISNQVQGVIIVPMLLDRPNTQHLDLLRREGIPIVFCTDCYAGCEEPRVMCDFEVGEYEVTRHLIEKGARNFWYVSTKIQANFTQMRLAGYLRALREAGIPEGDSKYLILDEPRYDQAYDSADQIIDDLPDAVVCINDIMTMAIMKRMSERGVSIPQDVAIVGYDDVMYADLVTPSITTVRQPVREICEKTMQLMVAKLEAGAEHAQVERGKSYLIPPRLVIRASSR